MTYATVMVSPILGRPNDILLEAAAGVARKLGAGVLGVGAARPIQCVCHDYAIPANVFEEDRKQIARQCHEAEQAFHAATTGHASRVEWRARSGLEPLADLLAREAASADLIMVGTGRPESMLDTTRYPDLCDLVMAAGRPMMLVPSSRPAPRCDHILVAWKQARESRRAIADALPLLARAEAVTVVEIAASDEVAAATNGLAQISAWLAQHGIKAATRVVTSTTANAPQLKSVAAELGADLIVAGAYGHNRQGRWVLGGITAELLGGDCAAFVSH
jgi:nucleotide-binding universal stress UspA family protein